MNLRPPGYEGGQVQKCTKNTLEMRGFRYISVLFFDQNRECSRMHGAQCLEARGIAGIVLEKC